MRTMVRILFYGHRVPGGAQAVLGPAGCGPDVATVEDVPVLRQVDVCVMLEEADPRIPVLLKLLKQHGVGWLEYHWDHYTEEELDSARLLFMQANQECEISGGVRYGMTYDLSEACSACGSPARQTSAVFVDGEDLAELEGHRAGSTIFSHILVDEALVADLEALGATGLSFRSVYARMPDKRQIKLRLKQLCAARTLPPMSPRTTGLVREQPCEVCWRNGYSTTVEEPPRIVYRATDLRDAEDVSLSWENRGYAVLGAELGESLLSYPWMVVTPRVRRVFRDAGVTAFDWLPIRVEDAGG